MKVTLLGTNDKAGGAARAMFRLHRSLLDIGVESRILCLNQSTSETDNQQVFKYQYNLFSSRKYPFLSELIDKNRTTLSNTLFSYSDISSDLVDHPLILDADVINLHWVNYFVSSVDIGKLLLLGKKIVWTLHDEWSYTGGCHYTSGCQGYLSGCLDCLQVTSELSHLPQFVHFEKQKYFSSRIDLITPSEWLSKKASGSPFFSKSRVRVIANSIEPEWFNKFSKFEIRKKFGYSEDCFLIGFGADSVSEIRKGLFYLLEALEILLEKENWKKAFDSKRIAVVFFGNYQNKNEQLDKIADYLGSFSEDIQVSEIYQMLDLFVIPSLEDNLPNTMLESMASGTPVLGFPIGGLAETIVHNQNGFLTPSISAESLAEQILSLWSNRNLLSKVANVTSGYAFENFSMKKQAEEYRDFFLSDSGSRACDFSEKGKATAIDGKHLKQMELQLTRTYNNFLKDSPLSKRIWNLIFRSFKLHDFFLRRVNGKRSY
ncbi:glycosyltransferase [Leptospira meyeri]|uniref:glycosyltransferase n=1 Tax=Leptospira meyeri TaxID=29508 RepID=UPI001083E364|nr:glycosyltransferase [Leptospira meyeri]TGL10740.1 glycosyltransferase [Leptospira meyeri]